MLFSEGDSLKLNRIDEIPDLERKLTSESIKLLMNSDDHRVNKLVMKFISSCTNIRDTLLLSNESDETYENITINLVLLIIN